MLIGVDLVKCLCEILEKKVAYSDVVLIVTCVETDFRNDEEWTEFWKNQISPVNIFLPTHTKKLYHYNKTDVHNLIDDLLFDGKLVRRERTYLLDTISSLTSPWYNIIPLEEHMTPAVQEAWNYFKILESLCRN
jgi:hypothetical protein